MLQFRYGATRFVILVGSVAIKFARLRPFWAIYRLMFYRNRGQARIRLARHSNNLFIAVVKYLLNGVSSNWREAELWDSRPQLNFQLPTLFSFFWLINVQRRGDGPVGEEELRASNPMRPYLSVVSEECRADLSKPENFCWHNGQICLLDCGGEEIFLLFQRIAHEQVLIRA